MKVLQAELCYYSLDEKYTYYNCKFTHTNTLPPKFIFRLLKKFEIKNSSSNSNYNPNRNRKYL